ncbi:hypothetical protein DYQ86_04250 [Acidobacteria bacterium AB60]|nr:hypothetical protein DYQ86_04250 [Acidobacteria bacterium AB60]
MDSDQWTVDSGQWTVGNGQWSGNSGQGTGKEWRFTPSLHHSITHALDHLITRSLSLIHFFTASLVSQAVARWGSWWASWTLTTLETPGSCMVTP